MDRTEVIHLKLGRIEDMFQTPEWDPMASHDAFEPGIDYCVDELRSRRSRSPVRLELHLPASQRDPGTAARLRQTVARYCEDRIRRNERERRIARRDGYAALKVGIPVALVGLAIAVATAVAQTQEDYTLPNLAGWVLAWVGLWYPLDTILFASVRPKRENGILTRLQDAGSGRQSAVTDTSEASPVRKARLTFVVLAIALGLFAQALPASAQGYPPIPTPKVAPPSCLSATTGSTLPQADVQSTATAIRIMAGNRFQGIAPCPSGRILLWLTPGSEGLAKQLQDRYGSAVTISVGLTTWNGHAARSPTCGSLPPWTAPPRGLALSLHLKADTVHSGDVVTGNVEITNRGTAPFFMDTGQPLQAVIVHRGTHRIVGAYTGSIAGTGYGMRLSRGQHENVPTLVGTARCDGGLGSALPPGKYQALVLVMDETGKGPRYLTPPTPLTVLPSQKGA